MSRHPEGEEKERRRAVRAWLMAEFPLFPVPKIAKIMLESVNLQCALSHLPFRRMRQPKTNK